jgi:hypothetical protein
VIKQILAHLDSRFPMKLFIIIPAFDELQQRISNRSRPCGPTTLIYHQTKHISFFAQSEHRLHKVIAISTKYPVSGHDIDTKQVAGCRLPTRCSALPKALPAENPACEKIPIAPARPIGMINSNASIVQISFSKPYNFFAGLPKTVVSGLTFLITTLPAPTVAL